MFGKLESGVGKGWGKGGVFSRFTEGELGTALSDSLRNLFTCGRATNNYRAYIGRKTTSPSGSHTT